MYETNESLDHFETHLLAEFTRWTTYSIALTLVIVRIASYRVCTSPLKYTSGSESRNRWIIAILLTDIVAAVISLAQSENYVDLSNVKVRAAVAVASVGLIWLCDIVISLLSLHAIFRIRIANRAITNKQRSDASKLVSFILLSISPSLQLLPFAYSTAKVAIDEWLYDVMMDCIDRVKRPDDEYLEGIEKYLKKCGYTDEDFYGSSFF
ncbi:hypothetical protein AAVH_28538 [Aphelenchoides avenae]|nr:hypothetical protein AAVH_28538 [Aphelenchus avenae]